jgi:hypothetical protein
MRATSSILSEWPSSVTAASAVLWFTISIAFIMRSMTKRARGGEVKFNGNSREQRVKTLLSVEITVQITELELVSR